MTAIFTALSEAPKADVVRFALDKSDECHNLRRANADLKRRMRALAIAAAIGMVLAFALGRNARAGEALVIDGDTLALDGRTVRLWGIDAPEIRQTCANGNGDRYRCGIAAARALETIIIGRDVTCTAIDTDRYGRDVARCATKLNFVAKSTEPNEGDQSHA